MENNKDIEQLLLSIQKEEMYLRKRERTFPIPTIRDDTRSPASLRADKLEEYTAVLGNRASLDSIAGTYNGARSGGHPTRLSSRSVV